MKSLAVPLLLLSHLCFAQPITLMTFNVENLFDTENDIQNPRDDTYLPLAEKKLINNHLTSCEQYNTGYFLKQCKGLDWSKQVYQQKLKSIGDVINSMPVLPDILVMPETENKKVLDDLISSQLSTSDYISVQLDSSDEPVSRGIDVGLLTRLPLAGQPQAHKIRFDKRYCGKTRDILQVPIRLPDGSTLNVFGVHFPSGGSPFECRVAAFKTLSALVAKLPDNAYSIAAGDFNINCKEANAPAFKRLLSNGHWITSPLIKADCQYPGSSKYADKSLGNPAWFTWSFLDMIMTSRSLGPTSVTNGGWFADLGSIGTVISNQNQVASIKSNGKYYLEPKRFDPVSGKGVSDHWPMQIRLMQRPKAE